MLSENVLLCYMYFLSQPGVYVGALNLIASIPGPSILIVSKIMHLGVCVLGAVINVNSPYRYACKTIKLVHLHYDETFLRPLLRIGCSRWYITPVPCSH